MTELETTSLALHGGASQGRRPAQAVVAAPGAVVGPAVEDARGAAAGFELVVALGTALHRYGAPAYRLEPCIEQVGDVLGLRVEVSVEPTALHLSLQGTSMQGTYGADADHPGAVPAIPAPTRFLRLQPGSDHLGRLAALDALAIRILRRELGVAEASVELQRILASPEPFGRTLELLAYAVVSAAAVRFFGGGPAEVGVGAAAGLTVGALGGLAQRMRLSGPLTEGLSAVVVTLGALAAASVAQPDLVVLAGLIVLIPGLRLTTAANELATGHLASGVARLASACVSFGALGYGVVLGHQLAEPLGLAASTTAEPLPLAAWTWWAALAVSPWAFAVILRAARRDVGVIALTAPLAVLGAQAGAAALGPECAGLVGALTISSVSNLLARWRDRPASVTLVPGILLLVPGSLGFQSLNSLMAHEVLPGVESAVRMVVVAMSLVAGMLVAAAFVPPRRTL